MHQRRCHFPAPNLKVDNEQGVRKERQMTEEAMKIAASWVELLMFAGVVVAGAWALWKWKRGLSAQRAQLLLNVLRQMRSKEMARFLYRIEYSKKWYGAEFHAHTGDVDENSIEFETDAALSFFCYVCYLMEQSLLKEHEIEFVMYKLRRVLMSSQVANYLYNLHHFARRKGSKSPFFQLEEYGVKHDYFKKEIFEDSEYHMTDKNFDQFLNW